MDSILFFKLVFTFSATLLFIKLLTLYAFSTENWKRPVLEVAFLMKLMTRYLKNELQRTGSDTRLSNFLMWQAVYSELFFTPTRWPDFTTDELDEMILDFHQRERRFGAVQ